MRAAPRHPIRGSDGRAPSLVPLAAGRATVLGHPGRTGRHLRLRGLGTFPRTEYRITGEVFGTAPRDLVRAVSLRRTVELVRIAITVAEEDLPALAVDEAETIALRDSLLRYSREVAFAAASVYAAAAETRGAWDARVEAAVVDGVVRGEDFGSLSSRAAALDWDPTADTLVIAGMAPAGDRADAVAQSPNGRDDRCGPRWPEFTATDWCSSWPERPHPGRRSGHCSGRAGGARPARRGLREAVVSAADALSGLMSPRPGRPHQARSTPTICWPSGSWPVTNGPPPGCVPRFTPHWPRAVAATAHHRGLPGGRRRARADGPKSVRPSQHRPLSTASDRRPDRAGPLGSPGPAGAADGGDPRPARRPPIRAGSQSDRLRRFR